MSVLAFRIFNAKPFGNGGERREAQLDEIYREVGVTRRYYGMHRIPLTIGMWLRSVRLIAQSQNRVIFRHIFTHPKAVYHYIKSWAWNVDELRSFFKTDDNMFVYEGSAAYHYPVVEEAFRRKKKVVAVMHNVESLVPGSRSEITQHYAPADFQNEVNLLRKCDIVFMISREETWLMRLYGVNAYYLPYYPAKECQEWLFRIRAVREQKEPKEKRTFLVIGSAINAPTAIGMQQLVDYMEKLQLNVELHIGGYGTAQHIHIANDYKNVVLLGELSQEQMTREMIECNAILINQPPTTGALTRIVEAEIAGVPVVANTDSMRDYFKIPGIYEYRTMDELKDVLSRDLQMPSIPPRPDSKLFIEAIQKTR